MKVVVISLCIILLVLTGSNDYETETERLAGDTIPPVIRLNGNQKDTAYHFASYWEKGATVAKWRDGELQNMCIDVEKSGTLNTDILGAYILYYNAADAVGNNAATVTRTVQVIDNSAAFLNGLYNVVCTSTTIVGKIPPLIKTDKYMAAITTGMSNGCFVLNSLKGDPEDHIPLAYLKNDSIKLDYGRCQNTFGSGKLSATKNSFTIETHSLQDDTVKVKYRYRNVFVKP